MIQPNVRQTPVHLGPAAWSEILGPGPQYNPLEGARTADILIVGAGFAGLSAARRLKEIDNRLAITVLEAGHIGEGATGRNSGFMIDIPHELTSEDYTGNDDRQMIGLNRKAQAFAQAMVDDFGVQPDYFDRSGKINGAASARAEEHNLSLSSHLAALGEPCELLDRRQMAEITGSHHYRSGLYTPGTVMLQPAGYVRGLAHGLVQSGVSIHTKAPVTALRRSDAGWTAHTDRGQITANKVILSVNGHLESFGHARGRLMQLFLFAVMTPDLPSDTLREMGGHARWGVTPSDPMGTTVRRIDTALGGNRIVTRTCAVLRPGMRANARDLERATAAMQRKFDARFPALAGMKMEHAWAGHLCLSLNGVSVSQEIEPDLFSACVQNGLGTTRGTLTGIAAAEAAMGVSSDIRTFFEAQAQPRRLPPSPVREWGANAVLRWKEWCARTE